MGTRTTESKPLIRELRAAFAAEATPSAAPAMQRYMKSALPYHGVKTVPMRAACKRVFARHPLADFEAWRDTALALFRSARYREERYAAIELVGSKRYREHLTLRALPMLEEMIVAGAWWDIVDAIATHPLGALLRRHPAAMKRTMLRWSRSDDLWKRRSAILCQNGFKKSTDLDLLFACIEPSIDSDEFFLRKAIGWALRQYAWTDPQTVVRYVRANESRLSGLSRREALKNVGARSARAVTEPARAAAGVADPRRRAGRGRSRPSTR